MKLTVAVVQLRIKKSPTENLKRIEKFVKKASQSGADLVVFPEYCLTNGEKDLIDEKNAGRKIFQGLAKKYHLDLVPGTVIEKVGRKLYNTTYYIDSKGVIKAKYRKNHLWDKEKDYLTPGETASVFQTKFGKVGLIICWDIIFPETFRKMDSMNAELIICPSYWCFSDAGKGYQYNADSEVELVDSACVERAFENEVIVIYCNAAGNGKAKSEAGQLIGHSQITSPFKGVLQRLNHNKEAMIIQKVDTQILKVAEDVYQIRADLLHLLKK